MSKLKNIRQSHRLFGALAVLLAHIHILTAFAQDEEPVIADIDQWIQATLENPDQISPRTPAAMRGQDVPGKLLSEMQDAMESRHQVACLKILTEHFPITAAKRCLEIAENRKLYVDVRQRAVWIAGILRVPDWELRFDKLLDDPNPEIQEAAIDALGMLPTPPYALLDPCVTLGGDGPNDKMLVGEPGIFVAHLIILGGSGQDWKKYDDPMAENVLARRVDYKNFDSAIAIPMELRDLANGIFVVVKQKSPLPNQTIEKLRQIAATTELISLRSAAARALVAYPPEDYGLRYAEWGVFISNDGKLGIPKSIIDEIPKFVHLTRVPIGELADRINKIMYFTKPIIHITVDHPLSIDVDVAIRDGAVWFSYPKPNDIFPLFEAGFVVNKPVEIVDADVKADQKFDKSKFVDSSSSEDFHDGYPWLLPAHRHYGRRGGGMGSENRMGGAGARWQFLYASPKAPPGTTPPVVSDEYKWWQELRKVPSSWIAAGKESERFLYYDGPTLLPSPLIVTSEGDQVKIEYTSTRPIPQGRDPRFEVPTASMPRGILIEVSEDHILTASPLDLSQPLTMSWPAEWKWQGTDVVSQTRQFVMDDFGLLNSEADGLLNSWSKQFFETPGRRIIARISRAEYDFLCPFQVRPLPTEISRVGLILHELPK